MQKVISVLGSPSESDLEFITDEKVKNFVNKLARRTKQSFSVMFPTANPVALDLLGKMLTFSPNKRYNVEQCLSHPYFEGLHDPEQEPTSESTFNFSFDSPDLTKEQLRQLIYEQCVQLEEEN